MRITAPPSLAHSGAIWRRFGIAPNDLKHVMKRLQSFGMEVEELPALRRRSSCSAERLHRSNWGFHVHQKYLVRGETHYANAKDLEIPQAGRCGRSRSGFVAITFRSVPAVCCLAAIYGGERRTLSNARGSGGIIYDVDPSGSPRAHGTGTKHCGSGLRGHRAFRYTNISHERGAAGKRFRRSS